MCKSHCAIILLRRSFKDGRPKDAPVLTIGSIFSFVSIFLRYYEDGTTPDIWWAAGWRCLGRRSGLRPVRHRATPPFIRAAALLHFLLRWPVPNPYYTSYYAPLTLRCPDTTTALFHFLLKLISVLFHPPAKCLFAFLTKRRPVLSLDHAAAKDLFPLLHLLDIRLLKIIKHLHDASTCQIDQHVLFICSRKFETWAGRTMWLLWLLFQKRDCTMFNVHIDSGWKWNWVGDALVGSDFTSGTIGIFESLISIKRTHSSSCQPNIKLKCKVIEVTLLPLWVKVKMKLKF